MDRQTASLTALLEWVNSFPLGEDVKSLNELADGHLLWDILRDVDPTYFTSSLPEPRGSSTKWIPRYENLKFLHKTLASYIREECDQPLSAPRAGDGLQAIAKDASLQDFLKLFQLVLQATITSPRHQDYILKMISLTDASQQILKELIEEPEESGGSQSVAGVDPSDSAGDFDLAREERYVRLLAEYDSLRQERQEDQVHLREMNDRFLRLQDSYNIAKQDLAEAHDQSQLKAAARDGTENPYVKELASQLKQQGNDFADLEETLAKQNRKLEAAMKKISNLEASTKSLTKKAQDAQDELTMVKKESDGHVKKGNMSEKLRQQLQTSKREIETLRDRLEDYQKGDIDFENLRHENATLQTQIEEYQKLVPRIEEDNAESFRAREQLKHDLEALRQDVSNARKERKQDQATIAQLKQRVRSSSVSSVGSQDNADLEAEFSGLAKKEAHENEIIANNETQLQALTNTVQEQSSAIDSLQRQLEEAKTEPKPDNDTRRQSPTSPDPPARTGASEYGIPTLDGVAQPAHSLISIDSGTNKELKDLRLKVQRLQKALDSKSVDQQTPLPQQPRMTPEMKDLIAEVISGRKVLDENPEIQDWCLTVLEEGRKHAVESEKTVEQHTSTIANLEERLKDADSSAAVRVKEEMVNKEEKPSTPTPLQSLKTENTNLKRELQLMSSAFHNLASRHQYSGMTVQRKSETPSSWLGKQRRAVEGNLG
ncbi:MAG: hypothetical protein Q9168_007808, partial [Polycauliona sp. 1 TL-2023]